MVLSLGCENFRNRPKTKLDSGPRNAPVGNSCALSRSCCLTLSRSDRKYPVRCNLVSRRHEAVLFKKLQRADRNPQVGGRDPGLQDINGAF